ncbi:hypothetical protein DFA_04170 [Cavenderia fasciculata]|uniref:Ankyrin repeat-containing protein n=1 Tax=Cavenderia fasciculata TaxID=261658 RepID=F4Q1H3_CACFS|nr:uncharacterized protein DFA_04170 [Cavenderia fasciculata]EGG18674.1 hypothetical protein DFA_04170 [Cavenderia fasciculata]|eukprot:XP_004366578.1 hypothetical protein DFA_04170 [Cavenderia fasciculata]
MAETNNTTSFSSSSFNDILKSQYIRCKIFNFITDISKIDKEVYRGGGGNQDDVPRCRKVWLKGRDIIKLPHLGLISKYGMSWDFIKHYLPDNKDKHKDKDKDKTWLRRIDVITKYCSHRNATLDTLKHLLEWSPDYENKKDLRINIGSTSDTVNASLPSISSISNRDILEYLIENYPNICLDGVADNAAKCGYLAIIELLNSSQRGRQHLDYSDTMCIASKNGQLHIVQYLHNYLPRKQSSTSMIDLSSTHGHLNVLKFLHENRSEGCSMSAINGAAMNGHIEVVKFLYFNREDWKRGIQKNHQLNLMDIVSNYGHFEILKFLNENRSIPATCSTNCMDWAAKNGRLDILEYLHLNRTEGCSSKAMDNAAMNGHLNVVQWLHRNRSEGCSKKALDNASTLEVVQFLDQYRQEGATTRAMDNAATIGRLDIIMYLNENRTEGTSMNTMDNAIENGHLDIVKWLVENRSEGGSGRAMSKAIFANASFEMIHYIHENLKQVGYLTPTTAARIGRLDIIEFLDKYYGDSGGTWTNEIMDMAAAVGHLEIVQYLHQNRTEGCTLSAIEKAAEYNHLNIIKFLYLNKSEESIEKALDQAIVNGHLEIVRWIIENCTRPIIKSPNPLLEPPFFKIQVVYAFEIFTFLLQHDMIDTTLINSQYIKNMYSRHHFELVQLCNSLLNINTKIGN